MRRLWLLALAPWALVGCEQKLPGPLECEKMAYELIGRSPKAAAHSPKVRRIAERLVQGCLTVPFDKPTVACAQSGQNFLICAEELARRAPERKENLRALISDLNQLGGRGEATRRLR